MLAEKIHAENKYKWISIAFFIKILILTYFFFQKKDISTEFSFLGFIAGDTFSYFGAIDNLLDIGQYNPFYRMPGVGIVYFFLRLVFSKAISYTIFVAFQLIFDAVACYLLSKLAFQLTKSRLFFIITFILSVSNSYYSVFTIWLMSESVCTSTLIFSVYYFYQALFYSKNKNKALFLSGFFITWTIFCRPVYFPLFILYTLQIAYYFYKNNEKKILKSIVIFMFPFIVFDGLWIIAGYQHTHELHILQHSNYTINNDEKADKEAYILETWKLELFKYVHAFGGDIVDWNPDADITWFNTNKSILQSKIHTLPNYAFSESVNEDSLIIIKKNIEILCQPNSSKQLKDSICKYTEQTLIRYRTNYIKQRPLQYYVFSRIIIFKKLIFQQPTYNLYSKQYNNLKIIDKLIKISYIVLYYFYMLGCLISFLFIWLNRKIYLFLPIILLTAFGMLIYPYLRLCEYRYIVPVMPFVLLLNAYTIYSIINLFVKEDGKNTLPRFKRTKPTS